ERVCRRKRAEHRRRLTEIRRDYIAVAVDERHPMCGREEHVLRVERKGGPLAVERELRDRTARQLREYRVRGGRLGGAFPRKRQHVQFRDGGNRQYRRNERPPECRGDAKQPL